MTSLVSIKTVIRCRDVQASRSFYHALLRLRVLEEWEESFGRGVIFAFGAEETGSLEIYQMNPADPRYDAAFAARIANDKIDIQLRTDSVDNWVEALKNAWPFEGPADLPWGQRWIRLRDPDGLLIAIYEERKPDGEYAT